MIQRTGQYILIHEYEPLKQEKSCNLHNCVSNVVFPEPLSRVDIFYVNLGMLFVVLYKNVLQFSSLYFVLVLIFI